MSDINLADFEGMTPLRVGFQCVSHRTPNDLDDKHYPLFDEKNGCIAHVFNEKHARAIAALPALIAEVARLREEVVVLEEAKRALHRHHSNAQTAARHSDEANGRLLADNTALRADIERLTRERDELQRKLKTALKTIDELNQAYIDQNI